ncbi:ABC transporter ATP-binding protein [Pseudactinotalea sp. Z1732]|uniref:ABC transporter ATP-binding protein n=1 Tax=Micrococcales TaxID=85006 RepID=UPI003C7D6DA0
MSARTTDAAGVELSDVTIKFGDVVAVSQVDLKIRSGEFFTLLGPSGCGKTTLLRAIAGFNRQTRGSIELAGKVVDAIPAHRRDTGMVFQNYAVFPHLNVWDNVAYGLKPRKIVGTEADERIREALSMVDLTGYEERQPKQLSGGQQQRVVIARAIAIRPSVLLMDEPLANLDAKLRVRLRNDLRRLQEDLGITTIYVTHDQEEALTLSDRIAVMSAGKVMQVGTPDEIYDAPASRGVAEFIGEGTFLRGVAEHVDGQSVVKLTNGSSLAVADEALTGPVWVGMRPHDMQIVQAQHGANGLRGTIVSRSYLGASVQFMVDCGVERPVMIQRYAHGLGKVNVGDDVMFHIDPSRVLTFPGSDEKAEL